MGWVYLILVVVALVTAVVTAAAWFFGAATALAVFALIALIFAVSFSSADATASVVTVTFESGEFCFHIEEPALREFVRRYYPSQLVYSVSLAVTVLIIIELLSNPRLSGEDRAFAVIGALIAPLIVVWFATL